jgi:heme A synthase
MLIELLHRLTSGIALLLVIALVIAVFRTFPRGSIVRWAGGLTAFFIVVEALLGAALVLFGLVAEDESVARAWVMAFHLVNTLVLLACSTLTAWWAGGHTSPRFAQPSSLLILLSATLMSFLLLGASGAVTALGDTLFPMGEESSHFLVQLRIYHPILALIVGGLVLGLAYVLFRLKGQDTVIRLAGLSSLLYLTGLVIGLINYLLHAPIWLQILHLLVADLTWISLVLLGAATLAQERWVASSERRAVAQPTG